MVQHIHQVFTGFLWQDLPSQGSLIFIAVKQKHMVSSGEVGGGGKINMSVEGCAGDHPGLLSVSGRLSDRRVSDQMKPPD